jgi:uncharacterized membrane protein YdjX (TVP38/TMEM64 family)
MYSMHIQTLYKKAQPYRNVILLAGGFFILLPLLLFSYDIQALLYTFIFSLEMYGETYPVFAIIFFIIATMFAALIAVVGVAPLVPTAVLLWGEPTAIVLITFGWMLGDLLMYRFGVLSIKPIFQDTPFYQKVREVKKTVTPHTAFIGVLLLRLALPSEILGYALGVMRYHFLSYFLTALIAELILAVLLVYASSALLAGDVLMVSFYVLLTVAVTICAVWSTRNIYRNNHKK